MPRDIHRKRNPLLGPWTSLFLGLFQLDDSKSLHGKWLFHQRSTLNWLFGVPGYNLDLPEIVTTRNYTYKPSFATTMGRGQPYLQFRQNWVGFSLGDISHDIFCPILLRSSGKKSEEKTPPNDQKIRRTVLNSFTWELVHCFKWTLSSCWLKQTFWRNMRKSNRIISLGVINDF